MKNLKSWGFDNIEDLLLDWENDHVNNWDANNLLTKILTWQNSNIGNGPIYKGDYLKALKSIKAKTILMPCSDDLYFPPEDNRLESNYINNAELRIFNSSWGHCVANPGNDKGFELALDQAINDLLTY